MTNYTRAVYDYIRTLGHVGDEVPTAIHPYLMKKFDLTSEEAGRARRQAMRELTAQGVVERLNTRGRLVRIFGEYREFPDPWGPGGKFVETGLRPTD